VAAHVIDSNRLSFWLAGRPDEQDATQLEQAARRKLEALVAQEPAAGSAEIVIASGHPPEAMQSVIDEKGAGLLVVAANDTTKKRLGTTASRCVRVAHCDVLVLRDWQDRNFSKIVACVDLSGSSQKVIGRAIATARHCQASLDIVHVIFPPERDMWGEAVESKETREDFVTHARTRAQEALDYALEPFQDQLDGVTIEARVLESTDPSLRLTHYAEEVGADLVILGTRGHLKLGAYFLGTNAERLLHDAPVSVLAVRV
jgi:nucleotide-binding universal stress UspA family protein